jgi:hypothetical protein
MGLTNDGHLPTDPVWRKALHARLQSWQDYYNKEKETEGGIKIYRDRHTPGITPEETECFSGEKCRLIRPGHPDNGKYVTLLSGKLMSHPDAKGNLVREYTFDEDPLHLLHCSNANLIWPISMLVAREALGTRITDQARGQTPLFNKKGG